MAPQTAMLEGAEMRAMSVPQRLAHLRGLVVADRATSAATVGDMGVLSLSGAGADKSSKGRLGVPAHYDPMRRAELAAPHFVALVNELLSVNAAGGSNRSKDVVEMALLGGALCHTSSFIYQMTCGTYDSDAVAPAIAFLSADAANGKAAVVGRAIARTYCRATKRTCLRPCSPTPTPSLPVSWSRRTGLRSTSARPLRARRPIA